MKRIFQLMFVFLALGVQAQVKFVKTVNTVNDLQNLQPDDIHDVVFVKGYASAAAADGAKFVYDATSSAATNTVNVFKPVSVTGNGRWLRQDPVFQAGSTTVPSITFGLDPNTGFANSAADQIDIINGGTRRGYVDSAGSLRLTAGVASSNTTTGTAIITGGLGVSGAANVGGVTSVTDTTEATTGGAGALKTSGGIYSAKKIVGNTDLIVNTSLVYADSAASKVGIGTTGPDRKLDILDASNPQIRLTQTDGTVFTDIQTITGGHTLTTNTFGTRTTSTTVNDTSVLARQVQGGLAFDGVTAGANISHYLNATFAAGSAISLGFAVRIPETLPSPSDILCKLNATSSTYTAVNSLLCYITTSGRLVLELRDGAGAFKELTSSVNLITSYGSKLCNIAIIRDGTSTPRLYFNGIEDANTTISGVGAGFNESITATYFNICQQLSTSLSRLTVFSATLFNRALSASEVITLANQGVQEADKWGSVTASYTSDFTASALPNPQNNWTALAGTVTGDIDGVGSPSTDNTLRYWADGTSANHGPRITTLNLTANKRYRVAWSYFIPAGNTTLKRVAIYGQSGATFSGSVVQTVTGTWTDVVSEGYLTSTQGISFLGLTSASSAVWVGANLITDDLLYIKNVVVTPIGSILDADLSAGVGYQVPDRSSNNYHGLVSTSGTSWTLPRTSYQAKFKIDADGYLGDTTSRACIPGNARIESISAYNASNTPTFTVGDDSAAAANINAGIGPLTAAQGTDVPLLKRFATTGTDGRIYIDFTAGTATGTVFTIEYSVPANY